MKDLVYIYSKTLNSENKLERQVLGEIQTNFNISPTIDGTKDSAKMIVHSFSGVEIEPFSIIKHEATRTWWVVSHDRVIRYANETNYRYTHELELLGAIELLNARDLTDSGFNQNRYTIETFIKRVFKNSNFEFKDYIYIDYNNAINKDKIVDYVKTFENYTPLSAIREFLDSYNASAKLTFNEDGNGSIFGANLVIISKTGNVNKAPLNENVFKDVNEIKTMDKNSFGTSVVSNAENVISTKTKTYPTVGGIKVSGNEFNIKGSNACLRLPSNVFKVNWLQMSKSKVNFLFGPGGTSVTISFNPFNMSDVNRARLEMRQYVENRVPSALDWFDSNFSNEQLVEKATIMLYYEENYDPVNKQFISSHTLYTYRHYINFGNYENRVLALSNNEIRNNVEKNTGIIYYERGKDTLNGFTFFDENGETRSIILKNVGPYVYDDGQGTEYEFYVGDVVWDENMEDVTENNLWYIGSTNFIVNYIPMTDIKIKVDNTLEKRDSKLYNQNGKLTDSVALSKVLLSHSKEIESDNITKYGKFYFNSNEYATNNIPSVGDLVKIGNDNYVINNISMNYYQNETEDSDYITYYVDCEFTLSKNIAVKSLMVNPNTNIREYGIPQNFNVKRKQLYRDFYELGHEQFSDNDNWYLPIDSILNVGNTYKPYQEHTAIMKLSFNGAYGGTPSQEWYYQLESTTFVMKKSIYEVIDFKDNNIIGYGSQNVWCGFDISRIFSGMLDTINTPISYVDDNGEVKSIDLCLCTNNQREQIYKDYQDTTPYAGNTSYYLANYSVFIPSDIYDLAVNNKDFAINETNYEKDATEVPVFEYCCQIDDSEQIIIGSNILDTYEQDNAYLYSYLFVDKDKYNDNNFSIDMVTDTPTIDTNNIATLYNVAQMSYENGKLVIRLYESIEYNLLTNEVVSLGNKVAFDTTKDLMIIRHRILNEDLYRESVGELISLSVYSTLPDAIASYYKKLAVKNDDKYYSCNVVTQTNYGTLFNDTVYYYNTDTGANNLPSVDYTLGYSVAVRKIIPPSNASGSYVLANKGTQWYYNSYTGQSNLPTASNNSVAMVELVSINYPSNWVTIYLPQVISGDKSNWYNQVNPINDSSIYIVGKDDVGNAYIPVSSGDSTPRNLTFRFIVGNGYFEVLRGSTVISTITSNGTYTMSGNDMLNYAMTFRYKSNGGYASGTIYREAFTYDIYYPEVNIGMSAYSLTTPSTLTYMSSDWKKLFYPASNKHFLYYYYNGWVRHTNIEDVTDLYLNVRNTYDWYKWNKPYIVSVATPTTTDKKLGIYNNGWTYATLDTNVSYYYSSDDKYYHWGGSAWIETPKQEQYKEYHNSTRQWVEVRTLNNNDLYAYSRYYYKWNNTTHSWVNATTYEWVEVDNANNEYFTYNNTLYKYNATSNLFEQVSSNISIEREDLMFIIRDMENADISGYDLSLYINYYSCH